MQKNLWMVWMTLIFAAAAPWAAGAQPPAAVKLLLNWVPEPEFGGIYAAKESGAFASHGLDVEITAGGAGAPTWQMVATGRADFAVSSADEVLIARQQGADVVALFATYQTCPQGLMVHAARGLHAIADLFSAGTLAMEPGLPYVSFLKQKYGFDKVNVVAYDGGIAQFLHDPMYCQQCFVTSEPIEARKQGADPQVFLVADAGYNPYTAVIITDGQHIKDHPDQVKAMVQSLRQGWRSYLDDPEAANQAMGKLNKEMDAPTFAAAAAAQKSLIETGATHLAGLGSMTLDRWQTLGQQLVDLKVIHQAAAARDCFIPADSQ